MNSVVFQEQSKAQGERQGRDSQIGRKLLPQFTRAIKGTRTGKESPRENLPLGIRSRPFDGSF